MEILNLGNNLLNTLPEEMVQFTKLRILFFANNRFEEIPNCLGRMSSLYMLSFKSNMVSNVSDECLSPSLGWLILTDNRISSLPASIGRLHGLRKLMLANNKLHSLPDSLRNCQQLELIRLSQNDLRTIPRWLCTMPNLAWVAFSGNPAIQILDDSVEQNVIRYEDLTISNKVGEGTSGVVYKTAYSSSTDLRYDETRFDGLAVKLFKGNVSSDGHPSDEVYVSGLVGASHSHILPVLGSISEFKDPLTHCVKYGLLFPLIPLDCKCLGLPPTFATVSRDTYPEGTIFSFVHVLRILTGIASAAAYLHSKGIIHGDLYAHNIHVYPDGQPILVDFGAATVYKSLLNGAEVNQFEAIEVRAFGCLMEELLSRVEVNAIDERIISLQCSCFDADPLTRPSFASLHNELLPYTLNNV